MFNVLCEDYAVTGYQIDLDQIHAPVHFTRRVPGPVRRITARKPLDGDLRLVWWPPSGGTRIDGYRIKRTRDGHEYELLGETDELEFTVANPPPGEPWFYRVSAFNVRGEGGALMVYLHLPVGRLRSDGAPVRLHSYPIPAIPGGRLEIIEGWPERRECRSR